MQNAASFAPLLPTAPAHPFMACGESEKTINHQKISILMATKITRISDPAKYFNKKY